MAMTDKPHDELQKLFQLRLAGLTGTFVAIAGLVLMPLGLFWPGLVLALLGAGVVVAVLVNEVNQVSALLRGDRGMFGTNVAAQVLLAGVLVVGINCFSFVHYLRFDWTRDKQFTIPAKIRADLAKLRSDSPTTIVLHQRHLVFGQSAKPDNYDSAAERKVVEKVKDLVEQFQELGPRFKVVVLDVQEDNYQSKLDAVTKGAPELRKAIERSPESSIFFYASGGTVQSLGFQDIYQLDKQASKNTIVTVKEVRDNEASKKGEEDRASDLLEGVVKSVDDDRSSITVTVAKEGKEAETVDQSFELASAAKVSVGGKEKSSLTDLKPGMRVVLKLGGNLVLLYQGVEPFARKVLNIDEKKPRVGLAVIHELLSTEGTEDTYSMAGAKKALTARGFDTRDIILKKWPDFGPPEPGVFTFDESKFERLESQLAELEDSVKTLEEDLKDFNRLLSLWKTASLEELTKKYADQLGGRKVTDVIRRNQLPQLEQQVAIRDLLLKQQREERDGLAKEKNALNVDGLSEQRRITDLKSKAERMFADCDLLIIPRMTIYNVARDQAIPNGLYRLNDPQHSAVKEFMKAGKPILFCLGPVNDSPGRRDPTADEPDRLEDDLERLGFRLSRQTVLFNVESKSFAERRSGLIVLGANVEVPPVEFAWPEGAGRLLSQPELGGDKRNPIRESMRITARGMGKDQNLDLRLRHPRPVYYEPPGSEKLPFDPVFMMTNPACWNEDQPFPSRERSPRFEPPKAGDPTMGTVEQKRRGPFPIGVAVPVTLPPDWYADKSTPATIRLATIGHGGVFIGNTLSTAREKLLLDTCNWLLGRDDLLAKTDRTWQYPRVVMGSTPLALWQWGARLGLPLVFVYIGMVVLMVRRLR